MRSGMGEGSAKEIFSARTKNQTSDYQSKAQYV